MGQGAIMGPSNHTSVARFSPLMELDYLTFQKEKTVERKMGKRKNEATVFTLQLPSSTSEIFENGQM